MKTIAILALFVSLPALPASAGAKAAPKPAAPAKAAQPSAAPAEDVEVMRSFEQCADLKKAKRAICEWCISKGGRRFNPSALAVRDRCVEEKPHKRRPRDP